VNAFREFSVINKQRAMRWHKGGLDEWSISDWATALAGEVGELCNAIKKMRRVEDQLQGHDGDTPQPQTIEAARAAVGKEIGDVYAYLDLVAQRFGFDTWECVRDVFNQISIREHMPERMPSDFIATGNNPTGLAAEMYGAVKYALDRQQTNADFGYYAGPLTETFDRLVRAEASYLGEPVEVIEKRRSKQQDRRQPRVVELEERIEQLEMERGR